MGLDGTEPTLDSSDDSKSRSKRLLKPLASEDSLGNSHSDRHLSDHEDEDNWLGFKASFDQLQKRNSGTIHSMASTATLTSTESSHGNNSFSNSTRSPTQDRRGSTGNHKSPRRSPRAGIMSSVERQIAQLPLSTANGQAVEDDRGKVRSARRSSQERKPITKDGPPKVGPIVRDGKGSYYQPSKASLHDSKLNQPPKKPQRIRSRSKGPALRRKSQGDQKASSAHSERTTGNIASSGTSKRSKSCEPQSSATGVHGRSKSADRASTTKTKKKISPPAASRITRKKPSSAKAEKPSSVKAEKPSSLKTAETQVSISSTDFHESWPRPIHKQNKDIERQKQRQMIERAKAVEKFKPGEKIRRKKPSSSKAKKKETKDDKEEVKDKIKDFNDINEVITFFEEMAAQKDQPPPERGMPKKSNSARCVRRSQSPASSSLGTSSTHGTPSDVGDIASDILDPSNKRRQRRSSAPAKALAAFHQYKKSIGSTDFDESPSQAPPEKILLDVSELAALEIIRLGKDNSLKLDLFDLMKHLKKEQLRKNKG